MLEEKEAHDAEEDDEPLVDGEPVLVATEDVGFDEEAVVHVVQDGEQAHHNLVCVEHELCGEIRKTTRAWFLSDKELPKLF